MQFRRRRAPHDHGHHHHQDRLCQPADGFDQSRKDAVAEAIESQLRDSGIKADASDVISHLKIELPTCGLAAAATVLADLGLI